ncbi:MAG: hypothetical protein E7172_04000 [Firmicutes bacterium]|nr:hypothetical protein [Bacillota bacterium]
MEKLKSNKKIIVTIIITIIVSLLSTLGIIELINYKEEKNFDQKALNVGVKKFNKVSYQLPNFSVKIEGIFEDSITNEEISTLDKYLIEVVTTDGLYNEFAKYHVIKVKDVFEHFNFQDYTKVIFKSNGLKVTFNKEEIDDEVYFMFTKNGAQYKNGSKIGLLIPDLEIKYSISHLTEIVFD